MTLNPLAGRKCFFMSSYNCPAHRGDSEERGEVRAPELKLRKMGKSGLPVPSQLENQTGLSAMPTVAGSNRRQLEKERTRGWGVPALAPLCPEGQSLWKVSPGQVFPLGRWERCGWREGRRPAQLPRALCFMELLGLAAA